MLLPQTHHLVHDCLEEYTRHVRAASARLFISSVLFFFNRIYTHQQTRLPWCSVCVVVFSIMMHKVVCIKAGLPKDHQFVVTSLCVIAIGAL